MAFQFSLSTVLRVRTMAEEREERMLQRIQQEIAQTRQAIEQAVADITGSNATRNSSLFQISAGADVHASYGIIEQLKLDRRQREAQLIKLEELRDVQISVYHAARRDREMLTDMREEKLGLYAADLAKREQSTLDDNFIARRRRA